MTTRRLCLDSKSGSLTRLDHDGGVEVSSDVELLEALRAGSEEAFRRLVLRHHQAMVRVARSYVTSAAVAEEVAQETWMGVLRGLEGFENRSSLKTWIFTILINRARSRGKMEHRSIPISYLAPLDDEGGRSVDPSRFLGGDDPFDGSWRFPPARLSSLPEEHITSAETRAVIDAEIHRLPSTQQQVVTLRDVEGWSAEEVCEALGLSEGNQRVLLHRGRARLRARLEAHLAVVVAS